MQTLKEFSVTLCGAGALGANIATLCGDTGAGTSPLLYAGYGRFGDALTDDARP